MRLTELLTETRVGDITTKDFKLFVSSHVIDRVIERGLPFLSVDKILRKLSTVKQQILDLEDGMKFWLFDPSINISLGLRKINDRQLLLSTAIEGESWDSPVPHLRVSELTEQELTEQPFMYKGYPCTKDCSGHMAGYAWAERNGIDDEDYCGGSSNSFWEGCKSKTEGK
jgi:hypothetical protein